MALGLSAAAADTNLNMGMVLEPPNPDPAAGAAAAIDEVVYANLFQGLWENSPVKANDVTGVSWSN